MRIAFFWVGEDIKVPQALVSSIRRVCGQSIEVVQLSDLRTPEVLGVTRVQRQALSPLIMLARLQSYASLQLEEDFTFFCDADSVLLSSIQLPQTDSDLLLTPRVQDGLINAHFPEHYPEFEGKTLGAVMPFMFGAIAARRDRGVFSVLADICQRLPLRFQRWYGDQVSLKLYLDHVKPKFGLLDPNKHLHIMRRDFDLNTFRDLRSNGVQLITFKGPIAKQSLQSWAAGVLSC
jgi:hypothetical protein